MREAQTELAAPFLRRTNLDWQMWTCHHNLSARRWINLAGIRLELQDEIQFYKAGPNSDVMKVVHNYRDDHLSNEPFSPGMTPGSPGVSLTALKVNHLDW